MISKRKIRRVSDMTIYLFRILTIIAIVILLYTAYRYYQNPQRLLQRAKKNRQFFIVDDPDNSKKNIHFVYKGCQFEGEKYIGMTEMSFDVITLNISVNDPLELKGITKKDILFLENELKKLYPKATIHWRHPIDQLFRKSK